MPTSAPASTYQGHHADGSSIQRHSAGTHYPYVVGRTHGGNQPWFVLAPNGEQVKFSSGYLAFKYAEASAVVFNLMH